MRYIVQYARHMPEGHRYCVAKVKIEPGFNGRAIEVYDRKHSMSYHPTKRAAEKVQRMLTTNADHPIYGLDDLVRVKDGEVSEWLHENGRLLNVENHEARFEELDDEQKTALRIEFIEASLNKRTKGKPQSLDMSALTSVVDMANSHIEDILSGLQDGTYEKEENVDINNKIEALSKVRSYLAAALQS